MADKAKKTPTAPRPVQTDALFRAAADQAPQVMWIIDGKGYVTYLNRFWYDLVGGEPPKWHGHEWMQCVHPDDVSQMRERWRAASAAGSIFEGTRRVKGRDGTWHILSYRAVPVLEGTQVSCWVGMDSDVTELVSTQAALRSANKELEKFAYTVSHDLRTPLVTIGGFATRLQRELGASASTEARRFTERIAAAAHHMSELVEGLLALSEAEQRRLRLEDVDIGEMARDILDMLTREQPGRTTSLAIEPSLHACADRRLIASLLDNLLGNAWKFTSMRKHTEIAVGLAADSVDESVFFVKDNGTGFDMTQAAKLFTAFERGDARPETTGLGIGLATVQRVVARHGGRAWAESEPDKGACFFFALPKPREWSPACAPMWQ